MEETRQTLQDIGRPQRYLSPARNIGSKSPAPEGQMHFERPLTKQSCAMCRSTASAKAAESCCSPTTRSARWSRSATSGKLKSISLSVPARLSTSALKQIYAAAGKSIGLIPRGSDQLVYAIEDIKRAAALGIRSVLVADIDLPAVVGEMKRRRDLPSGLIVKISAMMAPANPASARISRLLPSRCRANGCGALEVVRRYASKLRIPPFL